jgi:hypothetical protein
MRKSIVLAVIVSAVAASAVAFLVAPPAPAQDKPAAAGGAWEYRYVRADRTGETQLNALGAEGWELAGSFQLAGSTTEFVMKRQKKK